MQTLREAYLSGFAHGHAGEFLDPPPFLRSPHLGAWKRGWRDGHAQFEKMERVFINVLERPSLKKKLLRILSSLFLK
jgi:ribosome modulation factor